MEDGIGPIVVRSQWSTGGYGDAGAVSFPWNQTVKSWLGERVPLFCPRVSGLGSQPTAGGQRARGDSHLSQGALREQRSLFKSITCTLV